MTHVQGIRPGTSNLYHGIEALFKGLEEGSGKVPEIGETAQKYFKALGDYTLRNMAPSLRYRDEDFVQKKEDIQKEYEKDLKNGTFTFGPMERNPDGSIKKYAPGSLGPRSLAQQKRDEDNLSKTILQGKPGAPIHVVKGRSGITNNGNGMIYNDKYIPIVRDKNDKEVLTKSEEEDLKAHDYIAEGPSLRAAMKEIEKQKKKDIHPFLKDIIDKKDIPLVPLSPANPNDSDWLPYGISRNPHVGILMSKNKHADLNFDSNRNINPNASFATTGFSKAPKVIDTKKIYRVII